MKFVFVVLPELEILQDLGSLNFAIGNRLFEQVIDFHKRLSANRDVVRLEVDPSQEL